MSVSVGSTPCKFLWTPCINFPCVNFCYSGTISLIRLDNPDNAIAKTIDKMGIVWYNTGR